MASTTNTIIDEASENRDTSDVLEHKSHTDGSDTVDTVFPVAVHIPHLPPPHVRTKKTPRTAPARRRGPGRAARTGAAGRRSNGSPRCRWRSRCRGRHGPVRGPGRPSPAVPSPVRWSRCSWGPAAAAGPPAGDGPVRAAGWSFELAPGLGRPAEAWSAAETHSEQSLSVGSLSLSAEPSPPMPVIRAHGSPREDRPGRPMAHGRKQSRPVPGQVVP